MDSELRRITNVEAASGLTSELQVIYNSLYSYVF